MKDEDRVPTPWTDASHVDFAGFRANAQRRLEATSVVVYQDIDGVELYEQRFSDDSTVLMHQAQYNALVSGVLLADPYTQACILYVAGKGPDPGPKEKVVNG